MLRIKGRILFLLSFLLVLGWNAQSQIYDPVKWDIRLVDVSDTEMMIVAKASIEKGWHIYNQVPSTDPEAFGPIPTSLNLTENASFKLLGEVSESKPITKMDPQFDLELSYYENTAEFKQNIEILSEEGFNIEGFVEWMVCNEKMCLNPTITDFNLAVNGGATKSQSTEVKSGILQPVKWSVRSESLGNDEYDIIMSAKIDDGWHIYSQVLESDMGPLPTEFMMIPKEGVEFIGDVRQDEPVNEYDPNFMMNLDYFEDEADFTQKVKAASAPTVECNVYFMVCNDEKCLTPEQVDFSVDLATGKGKNLSQNFSGTETRAVDELIPSLPLVNLDSPEGECGEVREISDIWMVFLFGFLGGLIALLTPCVFPMIPLTVSFFTKGGSDQKGGIGKAVLYGFFIFLIYACLSIPFHFGASSDLLSEIATNTWLNLAFFAIFLIFAISFFGYFELTLPSKFVNKVDNASNVGGLIGIFFMAVTLALVSFSCTGPILGTVLGSALKNGPWPITAAMAGFGIALGLPFALFAAFPSVLKKMPKSGGWLNTVKVILGFVELALALKFLSNADLVEQWMMIHRETFFLIWALIGVGLALYLFGIIRFPHDNPGQKIGSVRKGWAVAVLLFSLYLLPGILREPPVEYNLLSGFPPPTFYSWYDKETFHSEFDEFEPAFAHAKEVGKPVLIDFTGWACVNCRKMEETVWTTDTIKSLLEEEFVLVSLYVDARPELPADLQGVFEYEVNGEKIQKRIRTIGNKWATFQTHTFNNNSQPYYVMLSPDGHLLGNPVGYTPDEEKYQEYLECGINANEKLSSLE